MKCKKHSKYGAIRRPRVNCEMCWRQYIEKHELKWEPLIKDGDFWVAPKFVKARER
jgi:hypothetical protein